MPEKKKRSLIGRLLGRKSAEEKTLDELRKKKAQIDKIKEDMRNMTKKFKVENGQIKKVEDDIPLPQTPMPSASMPQGVPQEVPPLDMPPMGNQGISNEELDALMAERDRQLAELELTRRQNTQDDLMRQRQYQAQMMAQQQPQIVRRGPMPTQSNDTVIHIELIEDRELDLTVDVNQVEAYLKTFANAINTGTAVSIDNKIVNGTHIVLISY